MPSSPRSVKYQLGKLIGYVVSTKMNKSVTVNVPWLYKHPKYERIIRRHTKLMAHDEYELCAEGDMVRRPSRTRRPPPTARAPLHISPPAASARHTA